MAKQASRASETEVSIRLPRRLAGKKVILVEAEEYLKLKKRPVEVENALGKIARGDAAYRERKTKIVRSLSELRR